MQLRLHTLDLDLSMATKTAIERNIRLTLGRHAPGVAVALISLSSVRDPAGDVDISCRIRLRRRGGPPLTCEAHGADPQAAVALATNRLLRHLGPAARTRRLPGSGGMAAAASVQREGLSS